MAAAAVGSVLDSPLVGSVLDSPLVMEVAAEVFGPEVVIAAELIKACFNAPTFTDVKTETNFTYKLAPAYGKLNKDTIKAMDQQLKVCIASTVKELERAAKKEEQLLSWEQVLAVMQQNVALEPVAERPVSISNNYTADSVDLLKFDGSPDPKMVAEIMAFYTNTINDKDVLASTSIDMREVEKLALIVASTGAQVVSFDTFWGRTDDVQRTLLDIGVIRFPDPDHPFFKVYRLKLHAWRHCKRVLAVEHNSSGLSIELDSRRYQPRASLLAQMKQEVLDKASKLAEELFGASA